MLLARCIIIALIQMCSTLFSVQITGSMLVLYQFALLISTIATDVGPYNQVTIAQSDNVTLVKINEESIALHKEKVAAKTICNYLLCYYLHEYFYIHKEIRH